MRSLDFKEQEKTEPESDGFQCFFSRWGHKQEKVERLGLKPLVQAMR